MAALLPPGHCTTSSLAISFQSENITFLQEYDVITWGFPAKIGKPLQNHEFRPIWSRHVHADNPNDTCFVQNFN